MNLLEKIISKRKQTVNQLKSIIPVQAWEMMPLFKKEILSLKESLIFEDGWGIIAEFKRASPSKGIINDKADIFDVVFSYDQNGASGISILTEPEFFQGNNDDILSVAESLTTPILRKDFIIDEYQVIESKAIGADAILLIAAALTKQETKRFSALAHELGLEVLLEIHNESELDWISSDIDMVGVNNRNLKTFEVDINVSLNLITKIPTDKLAISESGISDVDTIVTLHKAGFRGFLIGETFMRQPDPGKAFKTLQTSLKGGL